MQKTFFFIWMIFVSVAVVAQPADTGTKSETVSVQKDARIDLLIKKQVQINGTTPVLAPGRATTMPGYRIQVANTTDRGAAMAAKTKVYQMFPELKAYVLYQAPYYRVRAGNFKDRDDAEDYRKKMTGHFDNNLIILRDIIEIRPEDMPNSHDSTGK